MAKPLITWSVEGQKGVVNMLRRLNDETYSAMRDVVQSTARTLASYAAAYAPIGKREYIYRSKRIAPGFLKQSIRVKKRRKNKWGEYSKKSSGLMADVGTSVGYARYVEFGSKTRSGSPISAQPYMYRAVRTVAPSYQARVERVLRRLVDKANG